MKIKSTAIAVIFLFCAAVSMAGCATAKGLSEGIAEDTYAGAKGAAAGGYGFWQGVLAADRWMKDNLW